MVILAVFLWISMLFGQLGAIPLSEGVVLYAQDIVLVFLILAAALRCGLLKKLRKMRLGRPIALFAVLGIVSLLANFFQYPMWVTAKGSLYLLRWAVYSLFYGVVVASPFSGRFWLVWLASYGVALGASGLVQFVLYPDLRNLWYLGWDPHYYRVFATLLDPNFVGILLALTIWVLLFLLGRFTWLVALVGASLLLTYSRSSYLALLAGVCTAIVYLRRWKEGMFLVLLVLLVVVYVPKPGGETLFLDRYDSTVARIQNWQQTVARVRERPLFGYGFNVLPFLGSAGVDSSLLFVGLTTGIAGVFAYLWLIVEQVKIALWSKNKALRVLFFASFAAVVVHSLFVNSLFYPWVMIWLWTLVGVAEKDHFV